MTSVSAGHIILTPIQPIGSGRPQRESNPGPPYRELRSLPLSYHAPPPPPLLKMGRCAKKNQVKEKVKPPCREDLPKDEQEKKVNEEK